MYKTSVAFLSLHLARIWLHLYEFESVSIPITGRELRLSLHAYYIQHHYQTPYLLLYYLLPHIYITFSQAHHGTSKFHPVSVTAVDLGGRPASYVQSKYKSPHSFYANTRQMPDVVVYSAALAHVVLSAPLYDFPCFPCFLCVFFCVFYSPHISFAKLKKNEGNKQPDPRVKCLAKPRLKQKANVQDTNFDPFARKQSK